MPLCEGGAFPLVPCDLFPVGPCGLCPGLAGAGCALSGGGVRGGCAALASSMHGSCSGIFLFFLGMVSVEVSVAADHGLLLSQQHDPSISLLPTEGPG